MFAHEFVTVINPGLCDEQVKLTGDSEHFATRAAAQSSANRLNRRFPGLGLVVVESDPSDDDWLYS